MKWFRLWTDILDDPKMSRLSDDEYRAFTYLLAMAAEEEKEGHIPYDAADISWRIRLPLDLITRSLDKLLALEIIGPNGNGWKFIHWEKRQFKSDDRSEYFRDWYQKKRASKHSNVEPNVVLNNVEQNRTDTEQIQNRKRKEIHSVSFSLPEFISQEDWNLFLAHRKSVKAPVAKEAYPTFIEKFLKLKEKGFEPHFVITTMVERSWRWFKPEWVDKQLTETGERKRNVFLEGPDGNKDHG
jgi:hypothetical protein